MNFYLFNFVKKLNALHKEGKIRIKRSVSRVVCLALPGYHGICLLCKSKEVLLGIKMNLELCETKMPKEYSCRDRFSAEKGVRN